MENTDKSAAPAGGGGAKEKLEKQARQLAYDVRYKVRGALKAQSGGKSDPATVKKAYLAQLGKSPANPAVKTRAKQMLVGEDYIDMKSLVADGVASAMFKVFVEHHKKDVDGNVIPHEEEIQEDETKEKTYKVRVTDKESGNSYVRNATRAKIAELRNNPNISSVEMTEYGEVTKSEKYKGSKTASVKSGKGVDYDGDGKVESGSKEHAGVVHNAIQKKKGGKQDGKDTRTETYSWKEAFSGLIEKKSEEEEKKITGKGVNNSKLIKVFPDEVKEDTAVEVKKENEKDPNGKAKKEDDEDGRSMGTKWNLVKNKMRAMGLNMSQKPEGELVEQGIEDILARLEKKRISKGGNPDASPLGKKTGRAMKAKQDEVRKKAGVKTEAYDNTKSPDYAKKKKALAKKHGGADKVKGHPQYESVGSAVDKALGAAGDTAKVAGKTAVGAVKVAGKVAKGAAKAAATVAGTPIGVAKAVKKGFKSGTQSESVGSAIDKGLGAVGDTAKVAGKTAVGAVKVASKVAKGAAKAAGRVAGTPIGVAKAVKKGFKSGTQSESTVQSALDSLNSISVKKN